MKIDKIRSAFEKAKNEGRIALIPYITVGFPEIGQTTEIVRSLVDNGADAIELGVAFSDPLGDGPTIQASGHKALMNGVTPEHCFRVVKKIRSEGIDVPIIFMGYYNTIFNIGLREYCQAGAEAGIDGIIDADLPVAEAGPLQDACDENGIALIPLVAITSTDHSIERACKKAKGFIYCISVLGVTGARSSMSTRVEGLVDKVRKFTNLPIAVGFGISTADHVSEVARFADGAVVGSQMINTLADGNSDEAAERVGGYIKSLIPGTTRKVVAN